MTQAEDNDRLAGAIADELMVPGAQFRARFVEARDLTRVGDLGSAEQLTARSPVTLLRSSADAKMLTGSSSA